jgi:hypothetical protein
MLDSIARPYQSSGLTEGRAYYVVEFFLPYSSITGIDRLVPAILPEELYDRALF